MELFLSEILPGVIVSVISFGFGYFLFHAQKNEEIRLEIYKRRLDCYEKLRKFLDDLDFASHGTFKEDKISFSKGEKDFYVKKAFQISAEIIPYVPHKIWFAFDLLYHDIDNLPKSLANLESRSSEIEYLIQEDINKYMTNTFGHFFNFKNKKIK